MIYIVQSIIALLIISFIISSIIYIYCKILKKESRALLVTLMSFISLMLMDRVRDHLIKNELIENIKTSKIEQGNLSFSERELSNITVVSEKIRTLDKNIYIVLMPQKDTIYMNQDFYNKNKFWVHYKKYEILQMKVPVGYIIKN
jgi:hypothetical protein